VTRRTTKEEKNMLRLTMILSGAAILVSGVYEPARANAKAYYVGTCKPGKADFNTIQEAVTAVPSGSTINVCPGTYPEQVTIQQPLTLQGVQNGNNSAVVITAPASGVLSATVPTSLFIVAQLAVSNSGGPVDISGITVDGTGVTGSISGSFVAGILYDSSPGTINHVVVQNLTPGNLQNAGVLFKDDNSVSPSDTLQNSMIYLPNAGGGTGVFGISVDTTVFVQSTNQLGSSSGTITTNILNNFITVSNPRVTGPSTFSSGVDLERNVAATVTGNAINQAISPPGSGTQPVTTGGLGEGIVVFDNSAPVKINNNSVFGAYGGVSLLGPGSPVTVNNNLLAPSNTGITLSQVSGATITGNQIAPSNINFGVASTLQVGIDFGCVATVPAISGNTFMSTPIALANVPNGISLQKNAGNFINVPTVEQLCP
jgi:Periplasmic copper-binding protein (NosD)